ncbi:hypothetical protein ID866_8149 [Astraeus odoratus]|nr:hypothetical protein ID866_8149 [Astraeus odoratus]
METVPTPTPDLWLEYKEFIVRDNKGQVVTQTSLPLQAIDGLLNVHIHVECLLDQGTQIVAIRHDLWEALGVPVHPDLATMLEAANMSKEEMLGIVENMHLKISGMEFKLQIHVVGDAPFNLLLGCPFVSLSSCVTHDQMSGNQSISLTDPNTGIQMLLSTKKREHPSHEPQFLKEEDAEQFCHHHCGVYTIQEDF